jgi:hypothetical protein
MRRALSPRDFRGELEKRWLPYPGSPSLVSSRVESKSTPVPGQTAPVRRFAARDCRTCNKPADQPAREVLVEHVRSLDRGSGDESKAWAVTPVCRIGENCLMLKTYPELILLSKRTAHSVIEPCRAIGTIRAITTSMNKKQSSGRDAGSRFRHELQRGGIHAVAETGRCRPVIENVTEMCVA